MSWKPQGRLKPPLGTVEIDWGHPLATGLIGLWPLNEGAGPIRNLARPFPAGTLGSGDSWVESGYGRAVRGDGSSSANTQISLGTNYGALFTASQAVSVFALVNVTDAGGNHGVIEQTGTSDTVNQAWLLFYEGGTWKFRIHTTGNVEATFAVSAGLHSLGGSWSQAANTLQIFHDGVPGTSGSTADAFGDTSGNLLMGTLGSGFYAWQGDIAMIGIWSTRLPDSAFRILHAAPYAFLREKIQRTYSLRKATAAPVQTTPPLRTLMGVGV